MILKDHCLPGGWRNRDGWLPLHSWSDKTVIQWGPPIIVEIEGKDTFFEVYVVDPKIPHGGTALIHCKGKTLEEAEDKAWNVYQRYLNCTTHEFERRDYTNGYGFCKHCGLGVLAFEPIEYCCKCNNPKGYGKDIENNWWCEDCYENMPKELWSIFRKQIEDGYLEKSEDLNLTEQEFETALEDVINHIAGMDKGEDDV